MVHSISNPHLLNSGRRMYHHMCSDHLLEISEHLKKAVPTSFLENKSIIEQLQPLNRSHLEWKIYRNEEGVQVQVREKDKEWKQLSLDGEATDFSERLISDVQEIFTRCMEEQGYHSSNESFSSHHSTSHHTHSDRREWDREIAETERPIQEMREPLFPPHPAEPVRGRIENEERETHLQRRIEESSTDLSTPLPSEQTQLQAATSSLVTERSLNPTDDIIENQQPWQQAQQERESTLQLQIEELATPVPAAHTPLEKDNQLQAAVASLEAELGIDPTDARLPILERLDDIIKRQKRWQAEREKGEERIKKSEEEVRALQRELEAILAKNRALSQEVERYQSQKETSPAKPKEARDLEAQLLEQAALLKAQKTSILTRIGLDPAIKLKQQRESIQELEELLQAREEAESDLFTHPLKTERVKHESVFTRMGLDAWILLQKQQKQIRELQAKLNASTKKAAT